MNFKQELSPSEPLLYSTQLLILRVQLLSILCIHGRVSIIVQCVVKTETNIIKSNELLDRPSSENFFVTLNDQRNYQVGYNYRKVMSSSTPRLVEHLGTQHPPKCQKQHVLVSSNKYVVHISTVYSTYLSSALVILKQLYVPSIFEVCFLHFFFF